MATTYDKASLVMIPSGYKDDKLYSVKPTDGSGDFTFSRDGAGASPATRVNASGLIEKGRENLLLQSNTFSNASWESINITETSGQSGYDGTSDAWLISKSASNTFVRSFVSVSGVYTFSVYAKAGSLNWIRLFMAGGVSGTSYFDLQNGVVGTTSGSPIDAKIESIGSGWYRCSVTHNDSSFSNFRIYPADADNDTSGTSGNIYIQDAQLEQGLVATAPAIETTTAPVSAGLLGDMPRLDYSGGATCPALLLEPSRVNSVVQSEYFNAWTALNDVSITANNTTSPEGVLNGSLMSASGTGSTSRNVRLGTMPTSADAKSLSIFAKANATNYIQLFHSGDAEGYVNFDLSSGAVGTSGSKSTGDIEPMGNGWYRCVANFDNTNSFGSSIYVGFATSSSASYGGGAVADTSSVYIYGAQYENTASYPTSYIPTYGSASTRGVDSCSKTGISSLIGQTEGTLFVEVDSSFHISELSDGTSSNRILFYTDVSTLELRYLVKASGTTYFNVSTGVTISAGDKIAMAYANNDCVIYKNGTLLDSKTSVTIPANSKLNIGSDYNSTSTTDNSTKQALLFKTRLTNAELAALTTI